MYTKFVRSVVSVITISIFLVACASTKDAPSSALWADVKSQIQLAEQAGARENAPLELRAAQDKLASANAAVEEKEFEKATYLLQKALADAELAVAIAQSKKSQFASDQVDENLDALKESL